MRMKIKRIDKAINYYDQLIDETERKQFKQNISTIVNVGVTLLLLSCTIITVKETGDADIINLTKPILLTIATTLSTGGIFANVRNALELNADIRKYKKIKRLLVSDDEKRYHDFLESEYPGLYDNIIKIYKDRIYNNQNSINYNRGVRLSGR